MFADFSIREKSRLINYVLIRTAKLVQMSHKKIYVFMPFRYINSEPVSTGHSASDSKTYTPHSFDVFVIGILSYLLTDIADVDINRIIFTDILLFPSKFEKLTL